MNNGSAEAWMKMGEKRAIETYVFNYTSNNEIEKYEEEDLVDSKKSKDRMAKIENYQLKIQANGQIVSLERNLTNGFNNDSDLNLLGWSPLLRLGKKSGALGYKTLLYLPKSSNEFVIIRNMKFLSFI